MSMREKRITGVTRRQFNRAMMGVAASSFAAPALLRGKDLNGRLRVAVIGAGGRGGADTGEVASAVDIVALCDVNTSSLNGAARRFPDAKTFTDFRKVFDKPD